MLSISQFAKVCHTTVKTLRHYDNIGLLSADYVSGETGYRFYRRRSAVRYYQILALKESGFTLKEIMDILGRSEPKEQLAYLEEKILLLKKQQKICEDIKKEYERIMTESKNFEVSKKEHQISILSSEHQEQATVHAKDQIINECASLIERALNEDQIISLDFDDLRETISGKTAFTFGTYYSPRCKIEDFDELNIQRDAEKASDLLVFFETSPDTDPKIISDAIESFLTSFSWDATTLLAANVESGEKGLTLSWICFV